MPELQSITLLEQTVLVSRRVFFISIIFLTEWQAAHVALLFVKDLRRLGLQEEPR
jgi:hypothetical protein